MKRRRDVFACVNRASPGRVEYRPDILSRRNASAPGRREPRLRRHMEQKEGEHGGATRHRLDPDADLLSRVVRPLSVFIVGMGLALIAIAMAGLAFQLFAAPP